MWRALYKVVNEPLRLHLWFDSKALYHCILASKGCFIIHSFSIPSIPFGSSTPLTQFTTMFPKLLVGLLASTLLLTTSSAAAVLPLVGDSGFIASVESELASKLHAAATDTDTATIVTATPTATTSLPDIGPAVTLK